MSLFRKTTTWAMIIAFLAAGGEGLPSFAQSDAGELADLSGPRLTVTVTVATAPCCGEADACCCQAVRLPKQPLASEMACCEHREEGAGPARAGCSSDSPLCRCTAEQRVPLEESLPDGLPVPQAQRDLCDCVALENRLASDELTVATSCGGPLTAAAPLPLPISVQLATLCCWRA